MRKTNKTIEDQTKKQIKAIEDYEKQWAEVNEIAKKDFNIDRGSTPHEEHKKILMDLLEKGFLNFII